MQNRAFRGADYISGAKKKNFGEVEMKAICIIGSPRGNGNTAYIVDKVIEGMKTQDIIVSRYCLGDMKIGYCLGCKSCYEDGKCIQQDDINIIMQDLMESDIVLVASPSYWGDITGQLKVFFDRNTPYCNTNMKRPIFPEGKVGISIAIRAGQTKMENIHIIESIEHYFGHLGIKPIAQLAIESLEKSSDLKNKKKEIDNAYELGVNILSSMR